MHKSLPPREGFFDRLLHETRQESAYRSHADHTEKVERSVITNIKALVCTACKQANKIEETDVPHWHRSVINFGIPEMIGGMHHRDQEIKQLESQIKHAIIDFEPRIHAPSLQVALKLDAQNPSNQAEPSGQSKNEVHAFKLSIKAKLKTNKNFSLDIPLI